MKRSYENELWTKPDGAMAEGYRHISYALFRTDHDEAKILGARCPDMMCLAVGESLPTAVGLDEEARRFLREESGRLSPLFVMTKFGAAILDKRYDRHAGIGLFLHIHARPESVARLLNHGVLEGAEAGCYGISRAIQAVEGEASTSDLPSYEALSDALRAYMAYPIGEFFPVEGNADLYGADLKDRMLKMAGFVGCGLCVSEEALPKRVKCYRPLLLEALLLSVLTQVRMASATRTATCRISAIGGEENRNAVLSIWYPIETSTLNSDTYRRLEEVHRHLAWVCELGGIILQTSVRMPTHSEKRMGKLLPEVHLTVEWLHDPAVLSTTDLKAKIRLLYQ
ncbi:MAG: hypothetical protein IJA91_00750 [Clostridia bacterium]|nr:hypothetical protein [Clostridia bacterium]